MIFFINLLKVLFALGAASISFVIEAYFLSHIIGVALFGYGGAVVMEGIKVTAILSAASARQFNRSTSGIEKKLCPRSFYIYCVCSPFLSFHSPFRSN